VQFNYFRKLNVTGTVKSRQAPRSFITTSFSYRTPNTSWCRPQ